MAELALEVLKRRSDALLRADTRWLNATYLVAGLIIDEMSFLRYPRHAGGRFAPRLGIGAGASQKGMRFLRNAFYYLRNTDAEHADGDQKRWQS